MPNVSTPHFSFPFTFTSKGASVCEQDTSEEIYGCVEAIANVPAGTIPEIPNFGISDLAFSNTPLNPVALVNQILIHERRADEQAMVSMLAPNSWQVTLTQSSDT